MKKKTKAKGPAMSLRTWDWTIADGGSCGRSLGFTSISCSPPASSRSGEIAELLAAKQPEVSHVLNGHFSRFTTDKVMDFLRRHDRNVTIQISSHKSAKPNQEIAVGM